MPSQSRAWLRAIQALIDAHPDEFDEYLAAIEQTTSLTDRRSARLRPTPALRSVRKVRVLPTRR